MKYALKLYSIEKINDYDNCKQTCQLVLNGNYLVNNPKEGIIRVLMQEYNCENTNINLTYNELEKVYNGEINKIQRPFLLMTENDTENTIKTKYEEKKNNGYFDITDMDKVDNYYEVYKDGTNLSIDFHIKDINRTISNKIASIALQENDICYALIGSIYKDLKHGGTQDMFLTPLVDKIEDLDIYINNFDKEVAVLYDNIEIEVFSRSHITQMNWYKRSMDKLVLPNNCPTSS